MFKATDQLAPQPAPSAALVPQKKAVDKAYFTAKSYAPGEMDAMFNKVHDDLVETGYSEAVQNATNQFVEEQNSENQIIIANLIEDETVPKDQKIQMLQQYNEGYVSTELRDKYAIQLASYDNSSTFLEQESQENKVDDLNNNLQTASMSRDMNDADDAIEDIGGEVVSLANFIVEGAAGASDFGVRIYDAIKQKLTKGEVDWIENSTATERLEEGFFLKGGLNLTGWNLRWMADKLGIKEDFDESYLNRGVGAIGEQLIGLADLSVEKGLFKNQEQAMFTLEAVSSLIPAGWTARRFYKLKHTPNGGADITTKANPKAAGDSLTEALTEKQDIKAKQMNTTKETIVSENVLPKDVDALPDDVIPDVNKRLDKISGVEDMTMQERLVFETSIDDALVKREARIADRNRRIEVAEAVGLTVNTATSQIQMLGNYLTGRLTFTQTPDYAFASKKAALNAAEKLKVLADEMDSKEIAFDLAQGIKTESKNIKNNVVIRDVKTKQEFTIDELKKTQVGKRDFVVEYRFNKQYDLLGDDLLGKRLDDSEISVFGSKYVGQALNRSFLGEQLFGTGFAAKWFEKSRASLSPKAGRIAREVQQNFNKVVDENKKLSKPLAQVISEQAKEGVDLLTETQLNRMFRDLSQKDIKALDTMQKAWRDTQDSIYEITNAGVKQNLLKEGYKKGFFNNKGAYEGAIRELSPKAAKDLDTKGLKVYDPEVGDSGDFVTVKRNPNRTDSFYTEDGRKLVKVEGNLKGKLAKDKNSSDYMLVKDTNLDVLPNQVVRKMGGHYHKEYKSRFFVTVKPKADRIYDNGKLVTATQVNDFISTKGTASTKADADILAKQIIDDLGDDYELAEIRNSSIDNLTDYVSEYRMADDVYNNNISRTDMRTMAGDDVLLDPREALSRATNRIVKTGTYSQFDQAFQKAFVRDFKDVLPNGRFPDSIDKISARGNSAFSKLEGEAKRLWQRQTHFQGNQVSGLDKKFSNILHSVADVFDKMDTKKLALLTRDIGDVGITGVNNQVKRFASLMYITFSSPLRHHVIQPAMYYEQMAIFPKTFKKTVAKTPMHVLALLHTGNPVMKGTLDKMLKTMNKADRAEFELELAAMKRQGVLDSIDQNLAVQEALKGPVGKLEKTGSIAEKVGEAFDATRGAFNKYGFSSGELTNRVGLWLQNKERWKADPTNTGKNWADIRNADAIGFEAWKQSGAMTSSGALIMQRVPFFSFLTQFQSIGMKGFMNLIQDNATNLTKADRVKLTAARLVMHGLEFGAPLASGKYLNNYFREHEDPEVRKIGAELARGVADRAFNEMTELLTGEPSDITVSVSASLGATNAYADVMEQMLNITMFAFNDPDARSPNIPSVQAIGRAYEKFQAVGDMFTMNPVTPKLIMKSVAELASVTSVGNNLFRGIEMYTMEELTSAKGNMKGSTYDVGQFAWQALGGFKSRDDFNSRVINEIKYDIDKKIKIAAETYNRRISNNAKNPEEAMKYIKMSSSMLVQEGIYSNTEMQKVFKMIIAEQKRKFTGNELDNLFTWIRESDSQSADMNKIKSYVGEHSNPIVRDAISYADGKPLKQLFKED